MDVETGEPLTQALVREIGRLNSLQISFLRGSLGQLLATEKRDLETYLEFCVDSGQNIEHAALSYNTVVSDLLREQIYFRRHRKYRYSTYDEVADSVYHNARYMDRYMHGLALTQFLWPNHLQLRRFFMETLPRNNDGRYLEIGPGHGLFMIAAMRLSRYSEFVGVDISQTSIELTRSVLEHPCYGPFSNYRLEHVDFLGSGVAGPFEAVVMGEVLEHVEQPEAFLAKSRDLLAPGGYFYMSTAVNSAVVDHIYLFRSAGEGEDMVRSAGFTIEHRVAAPHAGTTLEQCEAEGLPVSVAYALS